MTTRGRQLLPSGTRLGPVRLGVTQADRALAFWTDVVGLTRMADADGAIALGTGGRPLIVLDPDASRPVGRGETGLYHVALHFPARREFARALARLFALGQPHSPTDHLASEATYLWDPDGNGLELTFETPHRGSLVEEGGRYFGRTPDGRLHSGRDPLDVRALFEELDEGTTREDLLAPLAGLRVGHVHLHVAALDESRDFYRDVIGFYGMLHMRAIQMSDLGIDEAVPHTLAFNTWAGEGAPPPAPGGAGLRHFTLELPDQSGLEALASRLTEAAWPFTRTASGLDVRDPSANRLLARLQA